MKKHSTIYTVYNGFKCFRLVTSNATIGRHNIYVYNNAYYRESTFYPQMPPLAASSASRQSTHHLIEDQYGNNLILLVTCFRTSYEEVVKRDTNYKTHVKWPVAGNTSVKFASHILCTHIYTFAVHLRYYRDAKSDHAYSSDLDMFPLYVFKTDLENRM